MFKIYHLKKNYFSSPIIKLLLVGVLALSISCKDSNENNITFFGGKIKNPKAEYVYFSKGMKVLDSAKLDSYNKFSFQLDSIDIGLYTFNHGPEFQYLYLEPNDSLLIYLNTWDFDESLIFSGKGSAKNNYLINLYLQQEKYQKTFKHNYSLDEEEFSKLIDEGIKKHLNSYDQLIESEGEKPSDFFDKLAKTGIYFPFYYYNEHYSYYHKKALQLKEPTVLSDDFYSYRDNIDLNDLSLLDYGPNLAFINTYLYNLARDEKNKDPENSIFELKYMEVIVNNITIESYKNELLTKGAWGSLTNKYLSDKDNQKIREYFFANCTNESYVSEFKKAIYQKEKLACGDALPKIMAYNIDDSEIEINAIIKNSNAVIYFWPKDLGRIEILNEKLVLLKKNHPETVFIGIERNKSNEDWKKFVETKKLPKNTQFKITKNSDNYSWFEGDMARTIIVNNKGNIENGYVFFLDSNLNYYIKNINNQ